MEWWVEELSKFLTQYKWLLDAYVIEFFTEDHWRKLPASWQESLRDAELPQLSRLLLTSHPSHPHRDSATVNKVYPLSLLALVASAHTLSVSRQPPPRHREETAKSGIGSSRGCGEGGRVPAQIAGLDHLFRRHVKPKKQHEIRVLAEEVMQISKSTGCKNIIDVGSGQGHLARYLAYHCGLNVVTVDAVGCHLTAAAKFDGEVERDLEKRSQKLKAQEPDDVREHSACGVGSVNHVETVIQPDASIEEFLSQLGLCSSLPTCNVPSTQPQTQSGLASSTTTTTKPDTTTFILVGLHTCGNLAPTILRVYAQSNQVVGLVSVGCCYMKLSCPANWQNEASPLEAPKQEEVHSNDTSSQANLCGRRMASGQTTNTETCCTDEKIQCNGESVSATCTDSQVVPGTGSSSGEAREMTSTAELDMVSGYPMSQCLAGLPAGHTQLSYEAREVACHSIEAYRERVLDCSHHVRVHCHRAVVETILRKHGLRRGQVKISRRVSKLPFTEYATAVLEGLGLPLSELESESGGAALAALVLEWREVAVFFMLRQVLAPCVESVLLLDRLLYLREQGYCAQLVAAFDPVLSPRNLVITSHKTPSENQDPR